jgi:glycosyltransferase involved in cell wall biosynthesis
MFFFPYEPDYDLIENLPDRTVELAREKFGLFPGRRRIVYSGRLVEVKRVDLLIDDLVIAGDGALRERLQNRVPNHLKERFIWTGFLDDQAMLGAIYRLCDVLVLPSDYEPWALVINEAAAAHLAIISSSVVGAAAELVQDGVNGRLFPRGDLAKLTQCLLEVTDPVRVDQMKAASGTVLAEWRRRGDPVLGLKKALNDAGTLTILKDVPSPPHNVKISPCNSIES